MPATTWKLDLKGNAATAAKRAHREVAALVKVLRDLGDVAPGAARALDSVAGPSTIRNLRTQITLTKELGREMRRNNGESRRAPRAPRAPGAPSSSSSPVNRGRTRQEGMFTPGEIARLRAMGDRRRARDAAADERARREGNRRAERGDHQYFQRLARMRQQSFAENDRLRAGQQRAEVQRQADAGRELARRREAPAVGLLESIFGRGAASTIGAAASSAAGFLAVIAAIGSAMVAVTSATLDLMGTLAGLAMRVGQLAFSLGGAILQMIAFREGTLMTLSTLMRIPGEERMSPQRRREARASAAESELGWAQDFGRATPLSTRQVVELRSQAAAAGLQGEGARTLTAAAADAGALHPNDASTASRFILQMGQLRNSSVARSADYRPAAQAAGISETAAMRRAAIAAGVVQRGHESEASYQARIRTAQGNGQITGRQMYDAILAEQRAQLGSNQSGDFARSQSGSMAAVLSNLGEGFEAFVTSISRIEQLPGVVALKATLNQISDTLAGATANGKFLQGIFSGLLNRAAGLVGGVFGKRGFDGFLTEVIGGVDELLPLVQELVREFRTGFMDGIRPLIDGFRGAGGAVGTLRAALMAMLPDARELGESLASILITMLEITRATLRMYEAGVIAAGQLVANPAMAGELAGLSADERMAAIASMRGVGVDMGDGVAAGFRERQGHMQREISAVMASLPATARTDMQIKSPSRVMAEIGQYMAEGVTVGLDSGAGSVQSAMSSVVAPPTLPGLGRGMGAMGGVDVGGVTIHIDGAQDAAAVVDALRTQVEELFVGLFERTALAGGD